MDPRRKRGAWMNKASNPVLEFLQRHGIAVPIGVLDINLDASRQTINRALEDLEERGFVERDEDYTSYYRITERGRKYLEGEIDANDY